MDEDLTFRHAWSPLGRIAVGVMAAIPLAAPFELIVRPGGDVFTVAMIPFWLLSAGAASISFVLLAAAVIGLEETIVFDPAARTMRRSGRGAFGLSLEETYPFSAVTVAVRYDDDTQTSFIHRVEARVEGRGEPILIGRFDAEASAASLAGRLERIVRPE